MRAEEMARVHTPGIPVLSLYKPHDLGQVQLSPELSSIQLDYEALPRHTFSVEGPKNAMSIGLDKPMASGVTETSS